MRRFNINTENISDHILAMERLEREFNLEMEVESIRDDLVRYRSSWTYEEEIANKFKADPNYKVTKGWFGKFKIKFLK